MQILVIIFFYICMFPHFGIFLRVCVCVCVCVFIDKILADVSKKKFC